jgi:hypothetical protein
MYLYKSDKWSSPYTFLSYILYEFLTSLIRAIYSFRLNQIFLINLTGVIFYAQ